MWLPLSQTLAQGHLCSIWSTYLVNNRSQVVLILNTEADEDYIKVGHSQRIGLSRCKLCRDVRHLYSCLEVVHMGTSSLHGEDSRMVVLVISKLEDYPLVCI